MISFRTIFFAILLLTIPSISSADTQTFTSSGTFTVPAGVTSVLVTMVGGGGGGGGGYNDYSCGGGGGGGGAEAVSSTSLSVVRRESIPVIVGSGGTGGTSPGCYTCSTGGNPGTSGGASSFGSYASVSGGTGGGGGGVSGVGFRGGGAGGSAGGANGTSGHDGFPCAIPFTFAGPAGSGYGGNSLYGTGGALRSGSFNGADGSGYGAGGGGGFFWWSSSGPGFASGGAGGNGSGGFVEVTYTAVPPGTVNVSSNISSSWTIAGPATITGSGVSQSSPSQPTGTYTITWGDVPGYATPATQSLTLTSNGTITFSSTYVASTCAADSVSWSVSGTSCSSGAYGPLTSGSSTAVSSTNGNTGSVTLTCTSGVVSQSSPTCVAPSATLSGSNCTIASGGSFCAAPFTWTISDATSPNLFNSTTGTQYTTTTSGTGVSFAITKGNNTIQARDGTTVLRSTPVTGTCAARTSWDGSVCAAVAPPTVSISASPRRVNSGGSSTVSWSSTHVASCTITKNGAFFSSAHTSAGTLDTGITVQTEYKIDCEGNDGSTGNTATAVVNVTPGFTEF